MTQRSPVPSDEGDRISVDVAAWHLQVLLTSLSSFDGKVMFLTALNVAGISALIGFAIAADPIDWLFGLSLGAASLCVTIGLGRLWSRDVRQFPSPDEALVYSQAPNIDESAIVTWHFYAIRDATLQADATRRWLIRLVRILLVLTLASLSLVIATAVSTAY